MFFLPQAPWVFGMESACQEQSRPPRSQPETQELPIKPISKMPGQCGCSSFAPGRFQPSLDNHSPFPYPPPPPREGHSGPAGGKGGVEALLKRARMPSLGLTLQNNDTCKPTLSQCHRSATVGKFGSKSSN